jgi:zinc finger CCCH domain-containing protein 14
VLSSISVPVVDTSKPSVKPKERCKFYPSCSNSNCAFYHPTLPCKLFPNCKFGDSCGFVHPRCKFDSSCGRVDCNYSHSQSVVGQGLPPIGEIQDISTSCPIFLKFQFTASSIVPVRNYKSISITSTSTICKFFPVCSNTNCPFLHPKICNFGKGCLNKFDCNFYHFETASSSKFKWISPLS